MRNAMKKIICICVAIVGVSVFAPVCTTYAQANDVSEVDTSKARIVGAYAQVTADGVRLRKTASTSGTILELMYAGETVRVDWVKTNASGKSGWLYVIRTRTGTSGWVSSQYIWY